MDMRRMAAWGCAVLLTAGAVAPSMAGASAGTDRGPGAGHAHFAHPGSNPYFPLRPGTVSRYRGSEDGETFREKVTVTHRMKVIQGVRTGVVRDVVRRADGTLAEKTHDWYAADGRGNVWYFGEATATYDEHGDIESREGSWKAGRDGAVAGVIMPADPVPTDAYRQEFYRGHAEDQAWIVQRNVRVAVPYGKVRHAVRSFEWTRLEKDVLSEKLYGPGLGIVRERDVSGGNEVFRLISVSHS